MTWEASHSSTHKRLPERLVRSRLLAQFVISRHGDCKSIRAQVSLKHLCLSVPTVSTASLHVEDMIVGKSTGELLRDCTYGFSNIYWIQFLSE